MAEKTHTAERYAREWLCHQAASGYIDYDAKNQTFALSPEQAMVFALDDSPVYMQGAFDLVVAGLDNAPKVQEAFHSGEGVDWGDQSACLFCAVSRFFSPGYKNHLIQEWLPALDGVVEKLQNGARVADVGCGHGTSTLLMAGAFPQSQFYGYDYHEGSIAHARDHARHSGAGNAMFEVAAAKDFAGRDFDLVCIFDALHDMGDPVGAARHIRQALRPDGTLMIVEPMAGDTLSDNINPVGRVFYAGSTMFCVPTSLAQEVGAALGAQAGEAKMTEVLKEAGFTSVRRAAQTPFNIILEARP